MKTALMNALIPMNEITRIRPTLVAVTGLLMFAAAGCGGETSEVAAGCTEESWDAKATGIVISTQSALVNGSAQLCTAPQANLNSAVKTQQAPPETVCTDYRSRCTKDASGATLSCDNSGLPTPPAPDNMVCQYNPLPSPQCPTKVSYNCNWDQTQNLVVASEMCSKLPVEIINGKFTYSELAKDKDFMKKYTKAGNAYYLKFNGQTVVADEASVEKGSCSDTQKGSTVVKGNFHFTMDYKAAAKLNPVTGNSSWPRP